MNVNFSGTGQVSKDLGSAEQYNQAMKLQKSKIDGLPDSYELLVFSETNDKNQPQDVIKLSGSIKTSETKMDLNVKWTKEEGETPEAFVKRAVLLAEDFDPVQSLNQMFSELFE